MPVQSNQNLYSSLFKIDDNKKITDPIHNIINIVNNNVEEKKKRELNLIVYGLKVDSTDKSFTTIKKLMNDIGVNNNNIIKASYLKKKDVNNDKAPIKIETYNNESKFFILKSARKLQEYNQKNKTKIFISQDLSEIDRQLMKKLIEQRNDLNQKLINNEKYYFGIRDNKITKLNKRS
jgi:hypothetical protein